MDFSCLFLVSGVMLVPEPHIFMYFNLMDLDIGVWVHDEHTYSVKGCASATFCPYFAKSCCILQTIVNCDIKIAVCHKSTKRCRQIS